MAFAAFVALVALAALGPARASAAPAAAQHIPVQGVARDANDVLIPSGGIAIRLYADSLGAAPLYDSGAEFAGAIAKGIFDVTAGASAPLLLDPAVPYFLELDAAGVEVIGDAAGGRLRYYAGGGSRARGDLEARLTALENAMGMSMSAARAAPAGVRPTGGVGVRRVASAATDVHVLLGVGALSAAGGAVTGNLLTAPVGRHSAGGVQVELGPAYLFAPHPNPATRFVNDVGNDQGRSVRIRWRNDLRERPYSAGDPQPRIVSYTLYRKVGIGQAALRAGAAVASAQDASPVDGVASALPPGDWDVVANVPATLDTTYQVVAPTLCDSNVAGVCWSVFLLRAITDQTGIYHDAPVDSGYSVDNLAPGVPAGLAAQPVSGGTSLTWQPSTAGDFQYFRVYRDSDPQFIPGPTTLVQATATTSWTDPAHGTFTYKLTALDFNGNESAPAAVTITVGVQDRLPATLAFASLAPNPFNRVLALTIDVPTAAGMVELAVFDLAGRRVRTLAGGALAAGRHAFTWDGRGENGERLPAGAYLVRLAGAGRTLTRRTTLLP